MDHNEEKNLVFRIIKYCLEKDSIKENQLCDDLNLSEFDRAYVNRYLLNTDIQNVLPNHILGFVMAGDGDRHTWQYKLLPTAVFQYVDFIEIKEARKNAQEAKVQSRRAHFIAVLALVASLVVGVIQIVIEIVN